MVARLLKRHNRHFADFAVNKIHVNILRKLLLYDFHKKESKVKEMRIFLANVGESVFRYRGSHQG